MVVIEVIPSAAKLCIIQKHSGKAPSRGTISLVCLFVFLQQISGFRKGRHRTPMHSSFCHCRSYLYLLLPLGIFLLSAAGWVRLPFHPPEVLSEIAVPEVCRRGGIGGGKVGTDLQFRMC